MKVEKILLNNKNALLLFITTGHELEEIRVRALENIIMKLEHKLICEADLIHERHLFIRLLEWFNFPKVTKQQEVLGLLLRLSKNSAAAELIYEIGGMEFLTQVRKDLPSSLQPVVDQIAENTMKFPEVTADHHIPECIYQRQHGAGPSTDLLSTIDISHRTELPPVPDSKYTDVAGGASGGYFTSEVSERPAEPPTVGPSDEPDSFIMVTFPWLALTPTDKHVIFSTHSSLQSREPGLLISACEFLADVVFQDFPAEIFLQRPNIVKGLLSILGLPSEDHHMRICAAKTLANYLFCLRTRMKYYQDPALYTPKLDFTSGTSSPYSTDSTPVSASVHSSDTRPSVIGWGDTPRRRGDGRDGDTSGSSSRSMLQDSSLGYVPGAKEEMDVEDTESLQFVQMTLPQLCVGIIEKVLPLLKTDNEKLLVHLLHLLNEVLLILPGVMTPDIWEDSSPAAREATEKLLDGLELLGGLIHYHYHGKSESSDVGSLMNKHPRGEEGTHRLALIGVSGFFTRLLNLVIPLEKCRRIIPDSLIFAMGEIVFDDGLGHSFPNIQVTLLSYLQQLEPDRYQIYTRAAKVCQSLKKTCKFLLSCREVDLKSKAELLSLLEASVLSLPYHLHMPLITEFIKFFSGLCVKASVEESLQSRGRSVLLQFLAHPLMEVRQHTYKIILQHTKNALSVDHASEPNSTSCYQSRFLFHPDVLFEVVTFGLADSDSKVSGMAVDLTLHLIQSHLLMVDGLWQEFLSSLLKSLPILQTYAEISGHFGSTIISMAEPEQKSDASSLPLLEKFRATLRFMFSSDVKVRSEALKRLAWFLSYEDKSKNKLPIFSDLDTTNLANIFIVEIPRSLEDVGRSVFQVESLKKVYEIFSNVSVDPAVKKSAIDQLAIMLQDQSLHTAFRKEGGLEKVLEHVKSGISRKGDSLTNDDTVFLPACMSILRHLVHHDYTLRHRIAHDQALYYCIVRVALLHHKDERVCYEISHLLTLLLFDEVAKFELGKGHNPTEVFSLPAVLRKRCRLPFRCSTHYENSPNKTSLPPDPDPLQSGSPHEMLRVTWNVAWHSGMEPLLVFLKQNADKSETFNEFSSRLQLSPLDVIILQTSHVKLGLQDTIYSITNATSHSAVTASILRLLGYLVVIHHFHGTSPFNSLDWCSILGRFLKVIPSSMADETLLMDVLHFTSYVMKHTLVVPDNILQWIGETLYEPKGPLIVLLNRAATQLSEGRDNPTESMVSTKRSLDKELLTFLATYNSKLPYTLCRRLKIQQLRGDISRQLLWRLNVTDAPHFYNLASLEGTLNCLMHITARPGWSQECSDVDSPDLCSQVLSCLLEVVSAFHIGRGGTSMSYMGKGVTKAATLCLRHLAFEMATLTDDQKWTEGWLYSRQGLGSLDDPSLNWMLTLWAYRDPEVRAAGLGIAVALTSIEPGRLMMTTNCKHIPGGIWGAAINILLDNSECSILRQQAGLILVNLTSQNMPSGSVETQDIWQGPVVTDAEYGVSMAGLTALLALLHHMQFYQEIVVMVSKYYPQPAIHPVSVVEGGAQTTPSGSDTTVSTLGEQLALTVISVLHRSSTPTRLKSLGSRGQSLTQSGLSASSTTTTPRSVQRDTLSSTPLSVESVEYHSVATPCLVSAVTRLLHNLIILAPQDSFTCLKKDSLLTSITNLLDKGLLDDYLSEMKSSSSPHQLQLTFCDLVQMYTNIVHLLRSCVVYDSATRLEILADRKILEVIFSLIKISCDVSPEITNKCHALWEHIFSFFMSLLQLQTATALESLIPVLQRYWSDLVERAIDVLETEYNSELYSVTLQFLCVLLSEEGKLQAKHPSRQEDSVTVTELLTTTLGEQKGQSEYSGSMLGRTLVCAYDHCVLQAADCGNTCRLYVIMTLKMVLAVCDSAKDTALEMGLVENLLEHIKQTHVKISMDSLQMGKSGRKKDEPLVQELVLTLDLLRNFMYQNLDVKMACYHSGLHNLIHRLWGWCQLEPSIMFSALSVLSVYVARCPSAASSLAHTSNNALPGTAPPPRAPVGQNSLVHCLIRVASARDGIKEGMLRTVFGLLSTLALSSECRNIIWKCNFLKDFSELTPQKTRKGKLRQTLEVLWLELFVNLSFSTEGQQMILKINESVKLLLEYIEGGQPRLQECSLLILRNLCCHSSNKPKLLASEMLLPCLLKALTPGSDRLKTTAASALWALAFNNQKAKVVMKNANIVPRLQEALCNVTNMQKNKNLDKCAEDLQNVIAFITE
ncbi:hypothetical protein ScPMuIL_001247 [Solemya velum]